MTTSFDHEKLTVYQRAIEFSNWVSIPLEKLPKSTALWSQLDRAATSIPLNIAEGNGKWTAKDRAKFFDISRGSTLECSAILDVAVARGLLTTNEITTGKEILLQIVKMLVGLTKCISPDRNLERGSSTVGEPTPPESNTNY
ncbi:four helix bundle protein [Verrucomicrobiales bacterium BCK34]|nr:four helix bundle protein [Verrucomicrobiales bacterium BCK34]